VITSQEFQALMSNNESEFAGLFRHIEQLLQEEKGI